MCVGKYFAKIAGWNCRLHTKRSRVTKYGSALILSVTILGLMSVLGITFARLQQTSASAARNNCYNIQAKYIALSGVDYCTAKLRESASTGNYAFFDWVCKDKPETSLAGLQSPSYGLSASEKKFSVPPPNNYYTGTINVLIKKDSALTTGKENQSDYITETSFYICRVTDNSSKINLKYSHADSLTDVLTNLFKILDINDADKYIKAIIEKQSEYVTLDEVQQFCKLPEQVWRKILPYVCLDSYYELSYVPKINSELISLPVININSAPKEVLLSVWACNEGSIKGGSRVKLDNYDKISKFVDDFITKRPFTNWSDIYKFLGESDHGLNAQELAMLWSAICPLYIPNTYQPELHVSFLADRNMMEKGYMPCTLYPGGIFTIESLGLYIHNDQILSRYEVTTTVKIFNQCVHKTQQDFFANWKKGDDIGLAQAVSGPHPIGHEVAKLYEQDDVYERTKPENGTVQPSKIAGWLERANGVNNEASLHDRTHNTPNQTYIPADELVNFCDGKPGPVFLDPPLTEAPRGVKASLDFHYKPDPGFTSGDYSGKPVPIYRNFSLDEGIATEIYWDPDEKVVRASRTLCCSKETQLSEFEPRAERRTIYRGMLRREGFQELSKLGLEIFHENLDSWSINLVVGSLSYSELADPNGAGDFGYTFAGKIYRAIAAGVPPNKTLDITMQFSKLWVTVIWVPIIFPPYIVPVPIPVITGGHKRKLKFCLQDFLDIVFEGNPDIYTVDRPSDQLSLRNVAMDMIPPIVHTSPVSRTEFRIATELQPSMWYRFQLVWDDLEIQSFALASADGIKKGSEDRNFSDTPLNIWRVMDLTMEHQTEFGALGTYIYSYWTDFARFQNAFYQGKFTLPTEQNFPQLSNMTVTAFFPTPKGKGANPTVYPCIYEPKSKKWLTTESILGGIRPDIQQAVFHLPEADYIMILGGDMYQTPVVFESRIRQLHWPKWHSYTQSLK